MQWFYLYYGTTFCLKLETLVIIRFLFFYPIKIDILVTFERKTTEHGLVRPVQAQTLKWNWLILEKIKHLMLIILGR